MHLQVNLLMLALATIALASIQMPASIAIDQPHTLETRIEKRHDGPDDDDSSTTSSDYSTATYTVLEASGTPFSTMSSSETLASMMPEDQQSEPTPTSGTESTDLETQGLEPSTTFESETESSAPSTNSMNEPPSPVPGPSVLSTSLDAQGYKPTTTLNGSPESEEISAAVSEHPATEEGPKETKEVEMGEIHYV